MKMNKFVSSFFCATLITSATYANDFLDNVGLFIVQTGIGTSVDAADALIRSKAGDYLLIEFKKNYIETLTKKDIKEIRHALATGSVDGDGNIFESFNVDLSKEKLNTLKDLVHYIQFELRKDLPWQQKDIVDDMANAGVSLINKQLWKLEFGENPNAKDFVFGMLLSRKMGHYIKTKTMLKLCQWRLAMEK